MTISNHFERRAGKWVKNEAHQKTDRVSPAGQLLDQKPLRALAGKTADWNEIAKDCIAFASAFSGLLLGVEDRQDASPAGQQIPVYLPETEPRKHAERTVKVTPLPDAVIVSYGGQYIELRIPRVMNILSDNLPHIGYTCAIKIGRYAHPSQMNQRLLSTKMAKQGR